MNEKCPKGKKHDWDLVAHSSIPPVVGDVIICTKCGKQRNNMVDLRKNPKAKLYSVSKKLGRE